MHAVRLVSFPAHRHERIERIVHKHSATLAANQGPGAQLPHTERIKLLRESTNPQAQFLWAVFRDVFQYIGVYLEQIAGSAADVDLAIRWGFGWNQGPFEIWQGAGWSTVAQWINDDIKAGKTMTFDEFLAQAGGAAPAAATAPAAAPAAEASKGGAADKK